MNLTPRAIHVPLRDDERGTMRVGESNVTFDVVICEFKNGQDAESIAHSYSTLQLADVYAVIAYYLANREAAEQYLRTREADAETLRREIETKQPAGDEFRERILKRRAHKEQAHASPAE